MNITSAPFILSLGLLAAAVPPSAARAQPADQILIVPATKAALEFVIDLPAGVHGDGDWALEEIGQPSKSVPVQTVAKIAGDGTKQPDGGRLVVCVPPAEGPDKTRRFRLHPAALLQHRDAADHDHDHEYMVPDMVPVFAFSDQSPASLRLTQQEKPVLVYNHGPITGEKVPAKDGRRTRACYIHPLWGLNGEVLTDDFPKDHYHHHGVFWAWPHVEIGNDETGKEEHDLWMYKKIAPRFVRWLARETGPLAAVLGVENGWFVADRKVMIERVWIEVGRATSAARAIDLDFTWIPVDRPITLRGAEGKSYGGLTVRFAVQRQKDATVTVPAGPAADDLPETPLPWADMTYRFAGEKQPSGAAIFVPPDHPDFPPTWLTRHYGPLCVGWPGVKGKKFEPGKPIRLQYRIWIHPGAVDVAALGAAYEAYVAGRKARWERPR